jgi:hypothetical protein
MTSRHHRSGRRYRLRLQTQSVVLLELCKELEKNPAVEWGERLDSSKAIARGGRSSGFVPGATDISLAALEK